MTLYKRGRWSIELEQLDNAVLPTHEQLAAWLENIATSLAAGASRVEALDRALDETDSIVLAAASIHSIYGIGEGLALSTALRSFGVGSWGYILDVIELGQKTLKLDVVLKRAASDVRADAKEQTTIPRESPILGFEDWLVFYTLAVMIDSGEALLAAMDLMSDKYSRSNVASKERMWRVTRMSVLVRRDGYTLSEALEATGFSPEIVAGVREADTNGSLGDLLAYWTGYEPTGYRGT